MQYADHFLPEFDQEMASTRKVLERVPDEKFSWKAHAKSNTMGWNANHLAEIPGWVAGTLTKTEWDFSPPGQPAYKTPSLATQKEVLAFFDANVAEARRAIEAVKDVDLDVSWSLLYQGAKIFTMPRRHVIRSFVLNHIIHHRAILTVYLRLNDIPVPGLYGPSSDE